MTREPQIPMSPEELPQQHIHEVVTLPPKPEPFDCNVGYDQFPKGSLPSGLLCMPQAAGRVGTFSLA
jgi:hypothetical protein